MTSSAGRSWRRWWTPVLVTAGTVLVLVGCSGVSYGGGRPGADPGIPGAGGVSGGEQSAVVEFEVRCDSCRVVYGRGGSPRRTEAEFRWHATITVPVGDRVILRVTRLGDSLQELTGVIRVEGETVAREQLGPTSGPAEIMLSQQVGRF